jgi:hypothetical protein
MYDVHIQPCVSWLPDHQTEQIKCWTLDENHTRINSVLVLLIFSLGTIVLYDLPLSAYITWLRASKSTPQFSSFSISTVLIMNYLHKFTIRAVISTALMSNDHPLSLSGDPGSLYPHHNHRNCYTIISTQCYPRACVFVKFYTNSKLNTRVTPYAIELITQPAASALSPWTCPAMLAVSTARTRPAAGSQGRTPGRTCRLVHMLPRGGTAVAPWQQGAG